MTLAIVDDIGAIVVIAVFYTDSSTGGSCSPRVVIAALVAVMHRAHVIYSPVFAIAGFALWFAVFESGVHATIAGVVMGLLDACPAAARPSSKPTRSSMSSRPTTTSPPTRSAERRP